MKQRIPLAWLLTFSLLFSSGTLAQSLAQSINHITLPVRDLATSLSFYKTQLSLKVVALPGMLASTQAWFDLGGGQQLRLIEGKTNVTTNTTGGFRIALNVSSLKKAEQQLRQRNLTPIRQTDAAGKPTLQVSDPDGYVIALIEGKMEGPSFISSAGKWLWKSITTVE